MNKVICVRAFGNVVSAIWLVAFTTLALAQPGDKVRELNSGQTFERTLTGSEIHRYKFDLELNEFFQVRVVQDGVDVTLNLTDPNGVVLAMMDSPNSAEGPEILSFIAPKSGSFLLQVRGFESKSATGRYSIRRGDRRAALDQDRLRVEIERLFVLGMTSRNAEGQRDVAIKQLSEAQEGWERLADKYMSDLTANQVKLLKARALFDEAMVLLKRQTEDEYRLALEKVQHSARLYREVGDRGGAAQSLFEAGYISASLNDKDAAIRFYGEALVLFRDLADRNGEASTLRDIGKVYGFFGDKNNAVKPLLDSVRLLKDLGEKNRQAEALNELGNVYSDLGDKTAALESFNQALQLLQPEGDKKGQAESLNGIGLIYSDSREAMKAIDYFNQALRLQNELNDDPGKAGTLHNLGLVYSALADKGKALEYFNQVLSLRRAADDIDEEAKTLSSIGALYIDIDEQLKSLGPYNNNQAELVVQTGHTLSISSVAFSPEGQIIASGSGDHMIKLWAVASGRELRAFRAHSIGGVRSIKFSPDGRLLASGGDYTVKLWDIASGKLIRIFPRHRGMVSAIDFSPDGKRIAVGTTAGEIRLWDVMTAATINSYLGHNKRVNSIAFSPDGRMLASGAGDYLNKDKSEATIKVWAVGSSEELLSLSASSDITYSVVFSPTGRILASSGGSSGFQKKASDVQLWDVASGRELQALKGHANDVRSVVFSPDGKFLVSAGDSTIRLWDVATGRELKALAEDWVTSIALSPNGKELISANRRSAIDLWSVDTGKKLASLSGHSSYVYSLPFSPIGQKIAINGGSQLIRLWDFTDRSELKTLAGHSQGVTSLAFSPDGKRIASGGGDKSAKLWDVVGGEELKTLSGHLAEVSVVAFSPDGTKLASGNDIDLEEESQKNNLKIWDLRTGTELRTLVGDSLGIRVLAFSPDGKTLASGGGDVKIWDVDSGQELKTFGKHQRQILAIAFSLDGKVLASKSSDEIKLWDVVTGEQLNSFQPDLPATTREILALVPDLYRKSTKEPITADHKFQLKVGNNGQINLRGVATGKVLASLFALDERDWAVVTAEGLFDASPGARKLMHFVIGIESISLEQMKDVYYVPGLLQKILRGEPLPNLELFGKQDLFPKVAYEPLKPNQKQVTVRLINRGGGIGQVQVLFNGKELLSDARPKGFNSNSSKATLTIDLARAAINRGSENKIEIIARNAGGSLSTRDTKEAELIYRDESKSTIDPPNIYAIVGGISDYTGDKLKLNFAAKDAEDFARALELGAIKLLNGDKSKVHIRLLTSNGDKSDINFDSPDAKSSTATKADFTEAFSDFRSATPNDVFIVYLAGHGISVNLSQNTSQGGADTYLYLTQEATTTDKSVLSVKNSRMAMTISSDELKDLMKQNQALKQVLILDTCAAGAVTSSLINRRDLPSDQIRAIERLKDNTGFFVLMGTSADAVSYEASQYGQGLLTYSILQAMKGARLRESQFADVAMLFGYAQEMVPQMAKNIGGIQRPLIVAPDTSASFDIGKFTSEEQRQITLSNPKPIILRPNLRNLTLRFDNLKLTQIMTEQLRQLSYVQTRGSQSPIIFVEAEEMTDAVQPVGDYTIEGDTIKVSAILVKNNAPIAEEISLTGRTNEKEKVIKQLIEAMMRSLK